MKCETDMGVTSTGFALQEEPYPWGSNCCGRMMVSRSFTTPTPTRAKLPSSILHEELKRNKTSRVQIESEIPQLKRTWWRQRGIREIPRKMRRKFWKIFTTERKASREREYPIINRDLSDYIFIEIYTEGFVLNKHRLIDIFSNFSNFYKF